MWKPISLKKCLVILIFISGIHKAYSYSFTNDFNLGYYWKSLPINFQIFSTNVLEGLELESIVNEAIDEWNVNANYNIWNALDGVSSGTPSGNSIRWSNNFSDETGFDDSSTLAVTIRYQSGTYIEKSEIILNGNMTFLRGNQGGVLKTTILHEIGHTLGLGHSEFDDVIMSTYLSDAEVLQEDDVDGVVALLNATLERQETGFVASHIAQSSKSSDSASEKVFSCGTIDFQGGGPPGGNNFLAMMIGFVSTLLLGGRFYQGEVKIRS